jgi:type IV pilus assembly protein PilF
MIHALPRSSVAAFFGAALLLLALIAPASAQNATQATSEIQGSGGVGDPRTRAKLHTELGSMYFQDGNMAVALEELKIAIAIDPSYAPAYNVRGLVRLYLREMQPAEEDFKQALRLAENDPEINNNYGWFLCQTAREKDSVAYFLRAIKNPLYQTPDRAYLNAGRCSQRAGDTEAAEDFFLKALRFSPDNPQALLQLASINYKRGNFELAKKQLSDVVRKVEPNAELLWLALRIERRLGDRAAEAGYISQLRRKFSGSPEYQELLKGNFE